MGLLSSFPVIQLLLVGMGNFASAVDQNFTLAKAQWSVDQIPDLTGKVVIVTGGNAGMYIGKLIPFHHHVY